MKASPKDRTGKKNYSKPALKKYGTVTGVTLNQGMTSVTGDGGMGNDKTM
jgi:hypothetical protein